MLQNFDNLIQETFNILIESDTTSNDEYSRYRELEISKFKERVHSLKQDIARLKSSLNVAQTAKQRIPLQNRLEKLNNELEVELDLLSQQLSAGTPLGREQQAEREGTALTKLTAIKKETAKREKAIKRETAEREAFRRRQAEEARIANAIEAAKSEAMEKQYEQEKQRIKQQYYPELSRELEALNFNERRRYLQREISRLESFRFVDLRSDAEICASVLTDVLNDEIWKYIDARKEAEQQAALKKEADRKALEIKERERLQKQFLAGRNRYRTK